MPKTVSIVVPSYNHAPYVEACLDSLYFQDYPDLELIVVDDRSDDGSHEIITQWVGRATSGLPPYTRPGRSIRYERNPVNLGSTRNYNKGFTMATGEYCSFMASDDMAHPQWLSTLARPLDQDQADFVYADMFIIDDAHRILREFKLPDYSFKRCFCDWYLCGVATLYRRSLHERFGLYDETSNADDHECYLRFALNGARFLHIPQTLYSARSHDQRQVGLHEPKQFSKLLNASRELTRLARARSHTLS